ncbi:MAG TPA: hypothetical protein VGN72_12495 [Tepidisphaeraceae bacterium]|jgi:hypothetical protein|nr:hypothetical protein [Tepidisphaeraceae bacterium]
MACVLAMLFLVLFSMMAIGFFATFTINTQLSHNESSASRALTAAESGAEFVSYHLSHLTPAATGASDAAALDSIYAQLATRLDGTGNAGGDGVGVDEDAAGEQYLAIPSQAGGVERWMDLGASIGQARMTLRMTDGTLTLRSEGRNGAGHPIGRGIEYDYRTVGGTWVSPGAGIITRSRVDMSNNARINGGNVISLSTARPSLTVVGSAGIAGDFLYNPASSAPTINNGGWISGHRGPYSSAPELPTVDTSVFEQFVPARGTTGAKVITASNISWSPTPFTNVRVRANSNTTFGSVVLNGVIFIETPNNVTFAGGCQVNGVIVTDTLGVSGNNRITLSNGVPLRSVETLNAANFPAAERIAEVRNLAGAAILAPASEVYITGGATISGDGGTIVAKRFQMDNGINANIRGNIIILDSSTTFTRGGGMLNFSNNPNPVPGLLGGNRLVVSRNSYREVTP